MLTRTPKCLAASADWNAARLTASQFSVNELVYIDLGCATGSVPKAEDLNLAKQD
jgi:hypothetical protein